MSQLLVLPSPHLKDLHVPLTAHTKHIQQHQRFLFHIYVGLPWLLMANRKFIGDEARPHSTQSEFQSRGPLGNKCSNSPWHLYMRPCDNSMDNVFSAGMTPDPSEATPGAVPRDSKPTLKDRRTLPSQLFL